MGSTTGRYSGVDVSVLMTACALTASVASRAPASAATLVPTGAQEPLCFFLNTIFRSKDRCHAAFVGAWAAIRFGDQLPPLVSVAFSSRCSLRFSCQRLLTSCCIFGVPVTRCRRVNSSTAWARFYRWWSAWTPLRASETSCKALSPGFSARGQNGPTQRSGRLLAASGSVRLA